MNQFGIEVLGIRDFGIHRKGKQKEFEKATNNNFKGGKNKLCLESNFKLLWSIWNQLDNTPRARPNSKDMSKRKMLRPEWSLYYLVKQVLTVQAPLDLKKYPDWKSNNKIVCLEISLYQFKIY